MNSVPETSLPSSSTPEFERLQGRKAAERFVELLTGDLGNSLSWRLFLDDKTRRKSSSKGSGINLDHQLDRLYDEFLERQEGGYGVFAVVNGGGHRDSHIDTIRAVFIDGDDTPLPKPWHTKPHFLVQRDDTHWHAYWLVKGLTPEQFTEVQRRLAVHYGTDPTISNPSRVMRVPGFIHLKNPEDPKGVTLIEKNTLPGGKRRRFSYEEISAGLPEVPYYVNLSRKLDPNRDKPVCELDLPHNIEKAERFLLHREAAIAKSANGPEGKGGNCWTYETACFIRDIGISEPLCNEVMFHSEWNQERCEPAWAADELAELIEHVYRYAENRPGSKRAPLSRFRPMADVIPLHPDQYQERRQEQRKKLSNTDSESAADAEEDLYPAYLVGELDKIPDPTWLIRDVLPELALGMTYGETGSLKTFLELDKALWGAVGQPWAASKDHNLEGFKVIRPLRTVIVAGEGARGIKRRIAAWAQRHEIKTGELPILVIPVMPRFANESDLQKLIRTIKARLPNPDHVIVDTAMWAATGLNLNIPADSQLLLEGFKRVMLGLNCSLTFVHHTGKDKARGQLGADNLRAGIDVVDYVELTQKSRGRRKIKISNQKMKDGETRELVHMEAYPEMLGKDEDGRAISSLVLRRCHGPKNEEADDENNPLLALALAEIAECKGKMPLSMNALAHGMVLRHATEELTDGELVKAKESMRNFLRKEATSGLAVYAHKAGKAKNAPWFFEDRSEQNKRPAN